ncbi:MAG: type II secretion system F family protein [Nitrososphaerota archaeon]|nr:type II secretion system F family protein [Nitrososphaerota archaeon]
MRSAEKAIGFVSRALPLKPPKAIAVFFQPRLEAGMLYVSPQTFARFVVVSLLLAGVAEVAIVAVASYPVSLLLLALPLLVQAFPFLLLTTRRWQRRRAVDSELPYMAMLFYILSRRSSSSATAAFGTLVALGPNVLPAFYAEAQRVLRDLTYGSDGDRAGIEKCFVDHPSGQLQEFIHGYSTAVVTGRDVGEFVESESTRFLDNQGERWRTYSSLLSSMTEVAFIFLAVFPIGIQMVAGSAFTLSSSQILAVSALLLSAVTCGLLLWMDANQPLSNDRPYSSRFLAISTVSFLALMLLYQLRLAGSVLVAASVLSITTLGALLARRHYWAVRDGDRVIGAMVHDLAELVRAGVELPAALDVLASEARRFNSVREPLAAFSKLLASGEQPLTAQRSVAHPSWMVRVSFALLSATLETGGGYEQLDKLSLYFRRIADSKAAIRSSVLPFAFLGVIVPAISAASSWLLKSMQPLGPGLSFMHFPADATGVAGSIVAASFLAGLVVSKAYSQSARSMVGLPPLLCSALVSFLFFGSA